MNHHVWFLSYRESYPAVCAYQEHTLPTESHLQLGDYIFNVHFILPPAQFSPILLTELCQQFEKSVFCTCSVSYRIFGNGALFSFYLSFFFVFDMLGVRPKVWNTSQTLSTLSLSSGILYSTVMQILPSVIFQCTMNNSDLMYNYLKINKQTFITTQIHWLSALGRKIKLYHQFI